MYVVSTDQFGSASNAAIRRVRASDGTIDWTIPDDNTGQAVLSLGGRYRLRGDAAGVILAGTGIATGSGIEGVSAIGEDGTVLWTQPRALDATIASDGNVVARAGTAAGGTSILALDVATGATKWELQPPVSGLVRRAHRRGGNRHRAGRRDALRRE